MLGIRDLTAEEIGEKKAANAQSRNAKKNAARKERASAEKERLAAEAASAAEREKLQKERAAEADKQREVAAEQFRKWLVDRYAERLPRQLAEKVVGHCWCAAYEDSTKRYTVGIFKTSVQSVMKGLQGNVDYAEVFQEAVTELEMCRVAFKEDLDSFMDFESCKKFFTSRVLGAADLIKNHSGGKGTTNLTLFLKNGCRDIHSLVTDKQLQQINELYESQAFKYFGERMHSHTDFCRRDCISLAKEYFYSIRGNVDAVSIIPGIPTIESCLRSGNLKAIERMKGSIDAKLRPLLDDQGVIDVLYEFRICFDTTLLNHWYKALTRCNTHAQFKEQADRILDNKEHRKRTLERRITVRPGSSEIVLA